MTTLIWDDFTRGPTGRAILPGRWAARLGILCVVIGLMFVGSPAFAIHCGTMNASGVPETCPAEALSDVIEVEMLTTLGTIRLGLLPGVAPLNVASFLSYIESGDYDNLVVRSVISETGIDVIQAGAYAFVDGFFEGRVFGTAANVCNEPCIKNERGTIAMVKDFNNANTAKNQWLINVNDSPALDLAESQGGSTVIGRVLDGMDVVDNIAALTARPPSGAMLSLYSDSPFALLGFRDLVDNKVVTMSAIPDMPLLSEVEEDPMGYGCFDTSDIGINLTVDQLIAPINFEFDPLTFDFPFVSRGCSDPMEPEPEVLFGNDCSADGACLGGYSVFDVDEFDGLYSVVTFETVERSDVGLALLRDDISAQFEEKLIHLTVVPEASSPVLALVTVVLLHRRMSRVRNQRC